MTRAFDSIRPAALADLLDDEARATFEVAYEQDANDPQDGYPAMSVKYARSSPARLLWLRAEWAEAAGEVVTVKFAGAVEFTAAPSFPIVVREVAS